MHKQSYGAGMDILNSHDREGLVAQFLEPSDYALIAGRLACLPFGGLACHKQWGIC
jgi:hypothetical protein